MREIATEIDIAGSPERVWGVLTAFEAFPEWNPFIRKVSGEFREGARLEVHIQPPGHKGRTFRPVLVRVRPPRELRWLGRLWFPLVFDGEHAFTIEDLGNNRVRFGQRERFRGALVPLLWRSLARDIRRGFENMNRALKDRVEGSVADPRTSEASARPRVESEGRPAARPGPQRERR
jgi:hypothetical protein